MYTLLGLHDGSSLEAVMLYNARSRIRLAVAGLKDAVELRLCGSEWLDERNQPVQFGFLLAKVDQGLEAPRVMRAAAGRAC